MSQMKVRSVELASLKEIYGTTVTRRARVCFVHKCAIYSNGRIGKLLRFLVPRGLSKGLIRMLKE